MNRSSRRTLALGALLFAGVPAARAQSSVNYEDVGGIRYQVTRQVVPRQIPVTQNQSQQQTYYRQQVTTENVQHQQMYAVPTTQYQLVSTLHGRWNPFVTPYWTHEYKQVTVWTQQMANVQIPMSRVAVVPESRTVQVPVTTYQTANQTVESRIPLGPSAAYAAAQPLSSVAQTPAYSGSASPLSSAPASGASSQPTATLAARPSAPLTSSNYSSAAPLSAGGVAMPSDPPRQATGWQRPEDGRYR